MLFLPFLVSSAFASAPAPTTAPALTPAPQVVDVPALKSADFSHDTLKVSFGSGGCSPTLHKVVYRTELISKNSVPTAASLTNPGAIGKTVKAVVAIFVQEEIPRSRHNCLMAFTMEDQIPFGSLLSANAESLGLDLKEADTSVEVEWRLATPIAATAVRRNFKK